MTGLLPVDDDDVCALLSCRVSSIREEELFIGTRSTGANSCVRLVTMTDSFVCVFSLLSLSSLCFILLPKLSFLAFVFVRYSVDNILTVVNMTRCNKSLISVPLSVALSCIVSYRIVSFCLRVGV